MSRNYRRWKENEKFLNRYVTDEGMNRLTSKTTSRRYRQLCRNGERFRRQYRRRLKSNETYEQGLGNRDELKRWGVIID